MKKTIFAIIFLISNLSIYGATQSDRAIAILDKGELSTTTSNFGLLSEFHFYAPSMHWPSSASFGQQYCFGLGPFAAVKDNVIESFLSRTYFDWEAQEGSLGNLHSGDYETPDGMPIMAISDADTTWPKDAQGKRFWPGPFRRDVDTEEEIPGEFTSERDAYCVFDDVYNHKTPLEIEVHQSSYSYSRTYAEDFIFFDFTIINKSDSTIHDMYWGYYAVFRPDFDFKDYLGFADGNFIYCEDGDGIADGSWESVGMIGIGILKTPFNIGITDFHFFDRTYKPLTDKQMWPVISSNPESGYIDSSYYFHGDNTRIDDVNWIRDLPYDSLRAWNFVASTGPFNFDSGDTLHSAIVVVAGSDSTDLFSNLYMARLMADRYYVGSGPPSPPIVRAVAGNKTVTLYWDPEPSESSKDALSGKRDFEGYKIYRSDDQGRTWGDEITDEYGKMVGYVPVAIFDLRDGIYGRDPAFPQSLGDDTGLRHTFTDTDVFNGIEYWYCVTAYDKGNQNPDSLEQSYECGKGRPDAFNVVSVIPGVSPEGWTPGSILGDTLTPVAGVCDGLAIVTVIDPSAITGHTYEITFNDSVPFDTTYITTFNLVDLSVSPPDTLLENHVLSDSSWDNLPVIDGFRLTLMDVEFGFKSIGWTKVIGDTCTFDWYTEDIETGPMQGPSYVQGTDDFRITIDRTGPGVWAEIHSFYGPYGDSINLPFYAEVVTDPENPFPVSRVILLDYRYDNPWQPNDSIYFGPVGWNLIPGGAGWNPNADYDYFCDELGFYYYYIEDSDTVGFSCAYIRTQNGPATAIAPSDGDEYTITTFKPFSSKVKYRFTTKAPEILGDVSLEMIRVVPNPYIVSADWEKTWYEKKLQFTHLPEKCDIHIYTINGDKVATIGHSSHTEGYKFWNMRNTNGMEIAYGLYIYVVETPKGKKKIGKFAVIK